jgi:hypothetical protein
MIAESPCSINSVTFDWLDVWQTGVTIMLVVVAGLFVLGVVLFLIWEKVQGIANAYKLRDGMAAYKRADYATALRCLWPLAKDGDREAQFNLGNMFSKGDGVPENQTLAYMWFELAAGQGREEAEALRDSVAARMSPRQLDEARSLVDGHRLAQERKNRGPKIDHLT